MKNQELKNQLSDLILEIVESKKKFKSMYFMTDDCRKQTKKLNELIYEIYGHDVLKGEFKVVDHTAESYIEYTDRPGICLHMILDDLDDRVIIEYGNGKKSEIISL